MNASAREPKADLTGRVVESFEGSPDARLREVMQSLVRHAHAFLDEVRPSEREWEKAISFLTEVGHITDDRRQEFILLSDVLGVSMKVVEINDHGDPRATESTVFGPFFTTDAPHIELGGDMAEGAQGAPCWVSGTVTDVHGKPVAGARIDVWEADEDGMYDVQYGDGRIAGRAYLFAADDGGYRFWGVRPTPYPIPHDGPVGEMLDASERSPFRASHLHFMVTAPGYRRLVTHIFTDDDDILWNDSVFGVKDSLIRNFVTHGVDEPTPDGRQVTEPWYSVRFDIVLVDEGFPERSQV